MNQLTQQEVKEIRKTLKQTKIRVLEEKKRFNVGIDKLIEELDDKDIFYEKELLGKRVDDVIRDPDKFLRKKDDEPVDIEVITKGRGERDA